MPEGVEAAALGLRFLLAFVFVSAAIPKLLDHDGFVRVVAAYRILPRRRVVSAAAIIPRVELGIGGALLLGVAARAAAAVATLLLLVFAAAIAINLRRGRNIECGCLGSVSEPISWFLVARDLLLAGAAAFCAVASRPSLAVDSVWSADGAISAGDAAALAITAIGVAVAESLVVEAIRATRLASNAPPRSRS